MTADGTDPRPSIFARWITRAPEVLSRQLWVWPLIGAIIIGLVGFWVRSRLEAATRAELATRLETVLRADITALRLWLTEREYDAKSFAADPRFETAVQDLVDMAKDPEVRPSKLAESEPAKLLQTHLLPLLEVQHYLDYVVVSRDKRVLASPHPRAVGASAPRTYDLFVDRALAGELSASRPFARELTQSQRAEGPTMFVAAPIKSTNGVIIAVLGLRMKPEKEFSEDLFPSPGWGETGETYAFDRRGMMLSATRFDSELKTLGLIPPGRENTAILNLKLLDPEGELVAGEKPPKPRDQLALTRMALSATTGNDGVDVEGYRNYRGMHVVGAWAWLREFGMGVATSR